MKASCQNMLTARYHIFSHICLSHFHEDAWDENQPRNDTSAVLILWGYPWSWSMVEGHMNRTTPKIAGLVCAVFRFTSQNIIKLLQASLCFFVYILYVYTYITILTYLYVYIYIYVTPPYVCCFQGPFKLRFRQVWSPTAAAVAAFAAAAWPTEVATRRAVGHQRTTGGGRLGSVTCE